MNYPFGRRLGLGGGAASSRLDQSIRLAAVGAVLLTAASWLGGGWWVLELLMHFRIQYVVAALALALVAVARKCRGSSLVALIVAAANLAPVWPYVMEGAIDVEAGAATSRLMAFNVHLENNDYASALALVREEEPDVVGFLEVDQGWIDGLSPLNERYPHSVLHPQEGPYGLAIFSRLPLRELETSPYIEENVQSAIMMEVDMPGGPALLTLAHLKAPTSPWRAYVRNKQLSTLAEEIRDLGEHEHILIGDLNITPWSPHYKRLEDDAGLTNAARGRGYWPTWPTSFSPVKIPIDHCLVSSGIRVQQFRTGADAGSDHLPIVVDVGAAVAAVAVTPGDKPL